MKYNVFRFFSLFLLIISCQEKKTKEEHKVQIFTQQKAKIRLEVTNLADAPIVFTHLGDPATGFVKGKKYVAYQQPDSSYIIELLLTKPVLLQLDYGKINVPVYVEPGYSTIIQFNADDSNNSVEFQGDGREENKLNVLLYNRHIEKERIFYSTAQNSTFDQFKQFKLQEADEELSILEEEQAAGRLSAQFYRWKKEEIRYSVPAFLYFPAKQHRKDYQLATDLADYDLDNNFAAQYSYHYNQVIGYYEVEEFVRLLKANKKPGHNYDHAQQLLKGKTRESYQANMILTLIKGKYDSLARLYMIKAQKDIDDSLLLSQINTAYKESELSTEKGYAVSKETIAEKFSAVYNILNPYQGKVIYIDFWASWCGPCIGKLDASGKLHEKYASQDIVFLYLGYKDKEEPWRKVISQKAILGEHHLLSAKEVQEVEVLFNIYGIPRYAIVDKAGNIAQVEAPFPDDIRLPNLLAQYGANVKNK